MRIVIIGAGHAGGSAAGLLRQYGFEGDIILVGAEELPPYQRPPLSKGFLKGESDEEDLKLKSDDFYQDQKIELRLGVHVERLSSETKTIHFEDGTTCQYDTLILATGAKPRPLPFATDTLKGIYSLRNIKDAEDIRAAIGPGKTITVIGGGYIGLEIAASARILGANVVIIEREERALARIASETLSGFFETLHKAKGINFIMGATVSGFEAKPGENSVEAVQLQDGRSIPSDGCIVGIGAVVCDELAKDAGLECDQGIIVNENSQTSDPSIYAIGDVALRPLPLYGNCMKRLESVGNALEQAKQAACHILGRERPAPEVPWFWSDQYDAKLQIAGMPIGVEDTIIRGSMDDEKFAIFHMKGNVIKAVEAVNSPGEFMIGRKLIGAQRKIIRKRLENAEISMRDVAE
ncbi:MAG: FAD-dependent oxidoreductase [Kordiimonadaceae bacterium]|nr:FAD-dependent oxidoreductase [Kordiimonadaceae bacterium]